MKKSSLFLTTAAFVAALAITSFSPVFVSPAQATGYDCGCDYDKDKKDKDKKGKDKKDKKDKKGKNKNRGGKQGNNGFGNGGGDGVPGNSNKQDKTR